jgi:hypothetical protein
MPMSATRITKSATIALLAASLCLYPLPASATCGGGGGGGIGGARAGGSSPTPTESYRVPWKIVGPADIPPGGALAVYWFPTSGAEAKESDLLTSRTLTMLSARCVSMVLITPDNVATRTKYGLGELGAAAILVDGDSTALGKIAPEGKPVTAGPVEALVSAEVDKREDAGQEQPRSRPGQDQGERRRRRDDDADADLGQHCLVPDVAKKAAKALKKIGHPVDVGELGGGKSGGPTCRRRSRRKSSRR